MSAIAVVARLANVPPLGPDGDEARRWAEEELSRPVYRAAEPSVFDRMARAVAEFLGDLFSRQPAEGVGPVLAVIATAVVLAVVVVAFVVWGPPRARRRSAVAAADLFGGDASRSAAELRADAAGAAAREDWTAAIVFRFRALARGLVERDAVDTPPGATVHAFARAAGRAFPDVADDLERSAGAFDDVRYLRKPGTPDLYARIAGVDDALGRLRPRLDELDVVAR